MAIELDLLKAERDQLKLSLREVEGEQRKLEAQLKKVRQHEIRTKRELEALNTLIEMHTSESESSEGSSRESASAQSES